MDVSQYLEIFISEAEEHIQDLSDCIMSLEDDPEDKDTINEIFRAAHSLKGMAGTMGYKRMQRLTHDMENVFQEVRSDNIKVTSELIDILFQCLDAVEQYLNNVKESSDEGTDDNMPLVDALNQALNGETPDGAGGGSAEDKGAAEEPKAEAADSKEKYKTIALSDESRNALADAVEKGEKIYGFTVYITDDCLLKAARAFLVFKAAEELGEIIAYNPSTQDIEDENFETDFTFYMTTDKDINEIVEAAKAVSEIAEVYAGEYEFKENDDEPAVEEAPAKEAKAEAADANLPAAPAKASTPAPAKASSDDNNAPAAKKQGGGKPVANRTVRVDIEKLDSLMNQVSELIIAKNSLVSIANATNDIGTHDAQLHEQIEYLERVTTDLHESVMKVRMVPIESVVAKFPRMIRDLSKKLNKKMQLNMSGEDTELDRTVVDQIGDPLQHLLRNSADHGLENAELRAERGKPEMGTINLNAFQEGNNVIIEVSDDGNGIDTAKVRQKAVERGLYTQEQVDQLSEKEVIDLLFMPSFSMAKTITDISGRGVGLDVVKSNIEQLGGDVEVKSVLGQGSKFTVRLPLTLAIIQALMVEIRDEKYAIALGSIQTIEEVSLDEIKYVQANEVIHMRGDVIPIVHLDEILDFEPLEEEVTKLTVVIARKGEKQVGLVVDRLSGQQEIVIKSLGSYIDGGKVISGATILGDGEVALILDVNTLM